MSPSRIVLIQPLSVLFIAYGDLNPQPSVLLLGANKHTQFFTNSVLASPKDSQPRLLYNFWKVSKRFTSMRDLFKAAPMIDRKR